MNVMPDDILPFNNEESFDCFLTALVYLEMKHYFVRIMGSGMDQLGLAE